MGYVAHALFQTLRYSNTQDSHGPPSQGLWVLWGDGETEKIGRRQGQVRGGTMGWSNSAALGRCSRR